MQDNRHSPQAALAHLLAIAQSRRAQCDRVSQDAVARIPEQMDRIEQELRQLRERIRASGVGADEKAENRYLSLLHDRHTLGQIHAMHSQGKAEPEPEAFDRDIAFGKMLLDVCEGGVLAKSEIAHIEQHSRVLLTKGDARAEAIARQLAKLLPGECAQKC